MALFARSRNHAREVELERRVNALQTALNQCKGVARQWWGLRVRFTVAVAVVSLALGFALGVYRHPIREAFVETAAAVGIAGPRGDVTDEAVAAFQKGDYAKALKLARPLADAGNPRAQAIVGFAYYRGRGVTHDDAEAATWLHRAADQGDAPARFTLGVMYGEGRGVPQDFAEAAHWYRLAAEQGDAQAQYNLGLAFARGEGVTQDAVLAHMWFNLAAARFPATDTRNRAAAVKNRDAVAGEMSSEQLTEAQKRALAWKPKSP
jgi:TPR repeat protein